MATGDQLKLTSFTLTASEQLKFEAWKKIQREKSNRNSTIGGRWTFSFTPTGLGTIITILDNETQETLNLTIDADW